MTVADEKCWYHAARAAAARCPECEKYYCRECITEHEGQVICATCLDALTTEEEREEQASGLFSIVYGLLGMLLSWLLFYVISRSLIELSKPLRKELPY